MGRCDPRLLLIAGLLAGSHAWHGTNSATTGLLRGSRAAVHMVDSSILREVAVYDLEMEKQVEDLKSRLQSSELNAAQNGELVGKAQADLVKQEEMRKALEAQVASLTEAKAEVEAQLKTKTEEVEKFVDSVEKELTEARESVKTLTAETAVLRADLEERTQEVGTLNLHLEAHQGVTVVLREENEELKNALAAAEANVAAAAAKAAEEAAAFKNFKADLPATTE